MVVSLSSTLGHKLRESKGGIASSNTYLLSAYCMPGRDLETEDIAIRVMEGGKKWGRGIGNEMGWSGEASRG